MGSEADVTSPAVDRHVAAMEGVRGESFFFWAD